MNGLTFEQMEELGFHAVRGWLEPASPYGAKRLREEGFYGPERREELERELDNVGTLRDALDEKEPELQRLKTLLGGLKEIRGTLDACEERPLSEAELFDLTAFCLRIRMLTELTAPSDIFCRLKGMTLRPVDEVLSVLHPEESGHVSFYIEDGRTPELKAAREEKRALEQRLRAEKTGQEELLRQRQEAVRREETALAAIYRSMSEALLPFISLLREDAEGAGHLDALLAKAELAARFRCSRPLIGSRYLRLVDAVHPQIEAALKKSGRRFVPLSLELPRGVTVITGANMGGKSVALKTVVLNAALALSGCFVFCRRAEIPAFTRLELINRDLSDAEQGLSSFGGEILRFNDAVRHLGDGLSFIAMDEFARGTNAEEGEAIARAAVGFLAKQNAVTLLTTHYDHTAELAVKHYQVKGLKKLTDKALIRQQPAGTEKDRLRMIEQSMDYGLIEAEPGSPLPRDAVKICRLLGMDERILQELPDAVLSSEDKDQ